MLLHLCRLILWDYPQDATFIPTGQWVGMFPHHDNIHSGMSISESTFYWFDNVEHSDDGWDEGYYSAEDEYEEWLTGGVEDVD